MDLVILLAIFVLVLLVLYLIDPLLSTKTLQLEGGHVLVTGGSSGIGRAIAVEVAQRGAHVTLVARNQSKLDDAKDHVETYLKDKDKQKVVCLSVDLARDYDAVEKAFKQAVDQSGPIDMLINCAGQGICGRFEEMPIEDFRRCMDINYHSAVHASRAVVGEMKRRQRGRIVLLSSQAGQLGLYGYTAYSAAKFALRGLAEALQMEVKPYNMRVCIAFPPDTDTPGLAEENKHKPRETVIISETAGLFQPEYVAKLILKDALAGKFLCSVGFDGWMLANLTAGMSPVSSIFEAFQQVTVMGIFRAISLCFILHFDRIIKKCKTEKQETNISASKSD